MTSWRILAVVCAIGVFAAPATWCAAQEDAAHSEVANDDHAADAGHGAAPDAGPLAIDPDLAIWTAIIFFVLLAVLWKFAWGPISEALDRREKGIADNIAAAAASNEAAKQLLVDYEARLAGTADQVREMLEEARRDGEHTKAQIVAEAKAAAGAEKDRAMRDVRNAKESALKEIGEMGANLAVELASKIVQREVSPQEHTQLIKDAVAKFPDAEPSQN